MSPVRRATICIFSYAPAPQNFQRCLASVLDHMPLEHIELRLAFASQATDSFHHALGTLCPDGVTPRYEKLPEEVERFGWTTKEGVPVWAWQSTAKSPVVERVHRQSRWLYHDVPLQTDYMIALDEAAFVEAGWWGALSPLLEQGIDYIGKAQWQDYVPAQAVMIQAQPWYMGVPFARQNGRAGVSFMTGGFLALRSGRLREANFPPPGASAREGSTPGVDSDVVLGEIARQLGWTQAAHHQHVSTPACTHNE